MKGVYVILTHRYSPVNEGPDKGKMQVHETCEFVDRIKDRHTIEATVIMDVENRKLVKNRAREQGATFEDMEQHMIKSYGHKYRTLLEIAGVEVPAELLEVTADQVVKAQGAVDLPTKVDEPQA
jgi:hypothetical protein